MEDIGDILVALKKLDEAIPHYQESLKIRQGLARANPEVALWDALTALSLFKLAKIGDRSEERYGLALKILRALEQSRRLPATLKGLSAEIEARLRSGGN